MSWLNKLIDWVEDLFDGDDNKSSSSSNKNKASASNNSTKKTTVENVITNPYGQASAKANQQAKKQEQNRNDAAYKNNTSTSNKTTSTSKPASKPASTTTSTTTSKPASTATTTQSNDNSIEQLVTKYEQDIAKRDETIKELLNPKILSALEVAKILGIDYNEANILKEYNKATNDYYDLAVKELQGIRSDYDKNNTQYLDQIMDSYLNSTKYSAPTATGKGALAANALSTLLSAAQASAVGDYDMIQDINATNEARKKDIANNTNLARQQYNDLGLALSNLSTTFDQAATKAKVNALDAYAQHYSADNSLRSQLANTQAAKYSGLANVASVNASAAANKYNNSFNNLYNYYKTAYGSDKSAANAIKEMLTASQGS